MFFFVWVPRMVYFGVGQKVYVEKVSEAAEVKCYSQHLKIFSND